MPVRHLLASRSRAAFRLRRTVPLDLSALPAGVYFVRVTAGATVLTRPLQIVQ